MSGPPNMPRTLLVIAEGRIAKLEAELAALRSDLDIEHRGVVDREHWLALGKKENEHLRAALAEKDAAMDATVPWKLIEQDGGGYLTRCLTCDGNPITGHREECIWLKARKAGHEE